MYLPVAVLGDHRGVLATDCAERMQVLHHEMTRHRQFSAATGVPVFFCDAYCPWQRGSNENTNGLLRQYFPKKTDLALLTADDLAHAVDQLNRRPRRALHWQTPLAVYTAALLAMTA